MAKHITKTCNFLDAHTNRAYGYGRLADLSLDTGASGSILVRRSMHTISKKLDNGKLLCRQHEGWRWNRPVMAVVLVDPRSSMSRKIEQIWLFELETRGNRKARNQQAYLRGRRHLNALPQALRRRISNATNYPNAKELLLLL